MEKQGFVRSIINAVVQEEKKKYAHKPRDLFINEKKTRWYQIMDLLDELDAKEKGEEPSET